MGRIHALFFAVMEELNSNKIAKVWVYSDTVVG